MFSRLTVAALSTAANLAAPAGPVDPALGKEARREVGIPRHQKREEVLRFRIN